MTIWSESKTPWPVYVPSSPFQIMWKEALDNYHGLSLCWAYRVTRNTKQPCFPPITGCDLKLLNTVCGWFSSTHFKYLSETYKLNQRHQKYFGHNHFLDVYYVYLSSNYAFLHKWSYCAIQVLKINSGILNIINKKGGFIIYS